MEEKEGDESATGEENETLPHDEAEDRRVKMEVKTFKELKAVLKPRCSPLWRNKKAHFFNLKWYSIHVVRTVGISALLVLLMFGFTSLPYSNPVEPGRPPPLYSRVNLDPVLLDDFVSQSMNTFGRTPLLSVSQRSR